MTDEELVEKCLYEIRVILWRYFREELTPEAADDIAKEIYIPIFPIIKKAAFNDGVKKATDACNSTFTAQLEEIKREQLLEDADRCAQYLDAARREERQKLLGWVIQERVKLKSKREKLKSRKPSDTRGLLAIGGKSKALQQVIDNWKYI